VKESIDKQQRLSVDAAVVNAKNDSGGEELVDDLFRHVVRWDTELVRSGDTIGREYLGVLRMAG
jgi:hypothetical protein